MKKLLCFILMFFVISLVSCADVQCLVSFDSNGGEEIESVYVNLGQRAPAPKEITKEGHTLIGWFYGSEMWSFTNNYVTENITLTAKWQINEYTITFDTDGGTKVESITREYDSRIDMPEDPTKEGYTFVGWDKNIPSTMPAEDLNIKAIWVIEQYTITFDTDGGSKVESIIDDFNSEITAPKDPIKEGYIFAGWDQEIPSKMPAHDMTIKAIWETEKFTITFDTDGGNAIAPITQSSGTEVIAPQNPTKEGFVFAGWDKEIPSTMPNENITIKAIWKTNQCLVTFDTDGGSEVESVYVDVNKKVSKPTNPTKVGYTFKGWYSGEEEWSFIGYVVTEDMTLTAKWDLNKYTITFDTDGGNTIAPITQGYNTELIAPTNPIKDGYTFVGWDKEIPSAMPLEGLEVKALWQVNQYTITFDTDGGNNIDSITQDYNTEVVMPQNPEKVGYTFLGWSEEIPSVIPAYDMIINAIWQINEYTITFDTDGGTNIDSITQYYNTEIVIPQNPEKVGYTFIGWDQEVPSTMPAYDMAIKAIWQINEYTIAYELEGGLFTEGTEVPNTYTIESEFKLPVPTKEGWVFRGWKMYDGLNNILWTISNMHEDLKLYALWSTGDLYVGEEGDYATLQDAINDATDGDRIVVMPGIYEGAEINKSVTIEGFNWLTNLSAKDYNSQTVFTTDLVFAADDITVKGVVLTETAKFASKVEVSIANPKIQFCVVRDSKVNPNLSATSIDPFNFTNVNGYSTTNLQILNCRIEEHNTGRPMIAYLSQVDGLTIKNCEFLGGTDNTPYNDGIKTDTATEFGVKGDVNISNNHFEDYQQYPIWFRSYGAGNYVIENNTFNNIGATPSTNAAVTFYDYAGSESEQVTISMKYNKITAGFIMFRIRNAAALTNDNAIFNINYNSLIDCAGDYFIINQTAVTPNIENNYWGTTTLDAAKFNGAQVPTIFYSNEKEVPTMGAVEEFTYNTFTYASPSNWNPLAYQDDADIQIIDYISTPFFEFDYKFDANGEIVPGEYEVKYGAVTKLEDVSTQYAGEDKEWNIGEEERNRAYKITLREDLKWEDGTPIKAEDFVYTMQEQLNPLFQHYRADSFYLGTTVIANSFAYSKQGLSGKFDSTEIYSEYSTDIDSKLVFSIGNEIGGSSYINSWATSQLGERDAVSVADAVYILNLYGAGVSEAIVAEMEGKTFAEIKANETYKAEWDKMIGFWQTEPNEELHFFLTEFTYPEVAWEKVGMFVGDTDYELVLILEKSLPLLKEDGSLSYQAAYNKFSLPLVKKDLYEKCKVAPVEEGGVWTTTYNTSVETTASWGPYELTGFQYGRTYELKKNNQWHGYGLPENEGLYQTTHIVCETIPGWYEAWDKFLAGEIDGIGIDVSIADEYKGSERAYFTPNDFVQSLQLQSSKEGLESREEEGKNKTLLTYTDFRKALSLSINRAEFAAKTTTSYLAGFGLFNSMHYYDVENGGVFRNTDEAKQVLCDIYGVDVKEFNSLDEAVDSITGYDLEQARELLEAAYQQALTDGEIDEDDVVELTFGASIINETIIRRHDYVKAAWTKLAEGTSLEGRITFSADAELGPAWANDFRSGQYDICMGGWSGSAWDPGYLLLAYLSPAYMYSTAWDTSSVQMTFTMKGVGENGADITETMSLLDWYDCLNGAFGAKYDWSATALEQSQRLQLIAALEKEVLKTYYTVPVVNSFEANLLSYKVDYVTYEYNTFMGYGGIKYMTYNFDDVEWDKLVSEFNGELNYK